MRTEWLILAVIGIAVAVPMVFALNQCSRGNSTQFGTVPVGRWPPKHQCKYFILDTKPVFLIYSRKGDAASSLVSGSVHGRRRQEGRLVLEHGIATPFKWHSDCPDRLMIDQKEYSLLSGRVFLVSASDGTADIEQVSVPVCVATDGVSLVERVAEENGRVREFVSYGSEGREWGQAGMP